MEQYIAGWELPVFLLFLATLLWTLWPVFSNAAWKQLEARYPDNDEAGLFRLRWQSGGIGRVGYRSCLTLSACPSGLRVAVLNPFERPFLVPWGDVSGEVTMRRRSWVALRLGDSEAAVLLLSMRSWKRLAEHAPERLRLHLLD